MKNIRVCFQKYSYVYWLKQLKKNNNNKLKLATQKKKNNKYSFCKEMIILMQTQSI